MDYVAHQAAAVLLVILFGAVLPTTGAYAQVSLCFGKQATIVGTEGDDSINGTKKGDVIVGIGGRDVIHGLGGADRICGGDGRLSELFGGKGKDRIAGGPETDYMQGGLGNDAFVGGGDSSSGDEDAVIYANAKRAITADLSTGKASGEGRDTFMSVEALVGSAFADHLAGNAIWANSRTGLDGNDTLVGAGGRFDSLQGNEGADVLIGSLNDVGGVDNLSGNQGDDKLIGNGTANGTDSDNFVPADGDDTSIGGDG